MPWKESEAVSEGNDPVPLKEELGSGQPMTEDVYRMAYEALVRVNKELKELSDKMDQRLIRLEHGALQSRLAMEADGQASQLSEEMKMDQHLARQEMDQHLARQEQDARKSRLAMEADGQASQLSAEMKMDQHLARQEMDQHLARLEKDARQSRLAMEADGQASTKTRERTEGAATAAQAIRRDCSSARRVEPGPTNSTSFGMKAEPPALPYRDVSVVECGAAAFKSCLPSMEMRTSTAAGGLVPTGDASKTSETILKEPPLRFCLTEETDLKAESSRTSIPSASYDSTSVFQERNLSATPYCRRVVDTRSGQNRTFDRGGSRCHLRACPFLVSWRAMVCGEV